MATLTIGSPVPVYVVPLTSNGNGTATDGSRTYTIGSPVPVYVVPLASNGNGTAVDGGNTLTVGSPAPIYVVSITGNGNGTATDGGTTYPVGSRAPIYVVPITGNGNGTATDGARTLTVGSPVPVYVVNLANNGNGSATDASVADVSLNFAANTAVVSGVSSSAASLLTTTRAGTAYADDLSGNWTSFAANAPRITNKGLLVEEARTNSIRNNAMINAVVGSPGTLPSFWADSMPFQGISRNVVGVGTENGIDYIDLRYSGTPAPGFTFNILCENNTGIVASTGQSWAASVFAYVVAGTLSGVSATRLALIGYTTTHTFAEQLQGTITLGSGPLGLSRQAFVGTLAVATTTNVVLALPVTVTTGVPVDFTVRIGWPQLELGSFATSPLRTTASAVTRAVDVVTLTTPPTFGSAYSVYAAGTLVSAPTTPNIPVIMQLDAGADINRLVIYRNTSGIAVGQLSVGGVASAMTGGAWTVATPARLAAAAQAGDQAFSYNGGSLGAASAPSLPPTPTIVRIGGTVTAGAAPFDGYITQIGIWASARLTNAQLQSITS